MTPQESIVLSNLLVLSQKVIDNDPTITDIITTINDITITDNSFNAIIKESVWGIIEKSTIANKTIIISIINSLTILADKSANLIGLLEARTIDITNPSAIASFIDSALSNTLNDFAYYSTVVKLAILLGDKTRIIAAINKIESLGD